MTTDLDTILPSCFDRCAAYEHVDPAVWIRRLTLDEARVHLLRIAAGDPATQPLRGMTFAIKDNLDLAGIPTTAACPAFAYTPSESAPVVERLITAGALPIGKTNLDQFATGLVGTRSPYGATRNVFNPEYISGGSSSGSGVAVAAGLVDVALGTDTAGSGRVPAALNGIVGLKPTRGRLSSRGMVPACRSLDCASLFARTVEDAARLLAVCEGFDARDPFSRRQPPATDESSESRHIGVPRMADLEWFGNTESPRLFADAIARLRHIGHRVDEIDVRPFLAAARLLYDGPWPAERYSAVGDFIDAHPGDPGIDPTVAAIIRGGALPSARDTFRGFHRLEELRRAAEEAMAGCALLVMPTITTVYTIEEVAADPFTTNSNLGRTNNFMNLLDLCGLTLPAGRFTAGPGFGITVIGRAWDDTCLVSLGRAWESTACTRTFSATTVVLSTNLSARSLEIG